MKISKEQWNEWQDNPVTQAVMAHLADHRKELEQVWRDRLRQATDLADPTIQHFHAACMAKDEVIEDLLGLTYEDVEEEHDPSA